MRGGWGGAAAAQIPNVPVIAAYGLAGAVALSTVDGIINLPLLNILVGAPVQVLGLLTSVVLAKRYLKDGVSYPADWKNAHAKVLSLVPEDLGLPKPVDAATEREWANARD